MYSRILGRFYNLYTFVDEIWTKTFKSINIYNDTESEYKRIAGNIFKDSDVDNIVVGIQFDSQILSSLGNQKKFNEYLRSIGIDD